MTRPRLDSTTPRVPLSEVMDSLADQITPDCTRPSPRYEVTLQELWLGWQEWGGQNPWQFSNLTGTYRVLHELPANVGGHVEAIQPRPCTPGYSTCVISLYTHGGRAQVAFRVEFRFYSDNVIALVTNYEKRWMNPERWQFLKTLFDAQPALLAAIDRVRSSVRRHLDEATVA